MILNECLVNVNPMLPVILNEKAPTYVQKGAILISILKGYCIVYQHELKSLEIAGIISFERMSKTGRKNSKGLNVIKI